MAIRNDHLVSSLGTAKRMVEIYKKNGATGAIAGSEERVKEIRAELKERGLGEPMEIRTQALQVGDCLVFFERDSGGARNRIVLPPVVSAERQGAWIAVEVEEGHGRLSEARRLPVDRKVRVERVPS